MEIPFEVAPETFRRNPEVFANSDEWSNIRMSSQASWHSGRASGFLPSHYFPFSSGNTKASNGLGNFIVASMSSTVLGADDERWS